MSKSSLVVRTGSLDSSEGSSFSSECPVACALHEKYRLLLFILDPTCVNQNAVPVICRQEEYKIDKNQSIKAGKQQSIE